MEGDPQSGCYESKSHVHEIFCKTSLNCTFYVIRGAYDQTCLTIGPENTFIVRRSITVWLTYCLTGLNSTKEVKLLIFFIWQSSWIQTSQTGSLLFSDRYFHLRSNWVFADWANMGLQALLLGVSWWTPWLELFKNGPSSASFSFIFSFFKPQSNFTTNK